jgi:uncharacterized protein with HEPN domain
MRSDRERLLDILEAIDKIQSHQGKTRSSFNSNDLLQVWAVHYLQIIGEAASRLSDEIREQYPDIQWGQIIGMRHVLVHGYFDVDLDIVWNAIDDNLPILKKQIEAILHKIDHSGS